MGCLSVHLYLPNLSAMFCSFQCMCLSHPWLSLFLIIFSLGCFCKRNCFLNFLSDRLWLVYRNITIFCMLILYPAVLMNPLIVLIVLGGIDTFLHIRSNHLQTDHFTSFLVWKPFIFFFLPISLARTFSIMFNRSVRCSSPLTIVLSSRVGIY